MRSGRCGWTGGGRRSSALPGGDYSPEKVTQAIELARTALDADRNRDAEFESVGAVSLLYIDSCVRVVDEAKCQDALGTPKCVDVTIRPHSLRLDLLRIGSNVLPIPRLNRPTFFDEVPAPLLALHPALATAYDRQFGLSQSVAVSTNLLDLSKIAKGEPLTPSEMQVQLRASGRKSLTEPFYNANTDLSVSRRRLGRAVEDLALSGHYAGDDEPLGGGRHVAYGVGTGISVGFRPRLQVLQRLTAGGGYRWSRDRLFAGTASEAASEHAGEGRVVAEACGGWLRAIGAVGRRRGTDWRPRVVPACGRDAWIRQGVRDRPEPDDRRGDGRERRTRLGRSSGVRALLRGKLRQEFPIRRGGFGDAHLVPAGAPDQESGRGAGRGQHRGGRRSRRHVVLGCQPECQHPDSPLVASAHSQRSGRLPRRSGRHAARRDPEGGAQATGGSGGTPSEKLSREAGIAPG